ncbi:MAG: hypothetical protein QOJ25_3089 [Solirubrobacteraceae bacterium]|nr:hypothetical protein [Solirubrobacteraceae bacterium]
MSARRQFAALIRLSVWRWLAPFAITVAGIVALVVFLLPYRTDIRLAVDRASAGALIAMTALSFVALPLRTEVWRASLAAAGRRPPRSDLHAANSASLLASLASHYVGPGVKMWLLRRMEGERAAYLLQLIAVDLAGTVLEAFLAAALVIFATIEVALAWWVPVLLISGASGMLIVAILARRRYPDAPIVQGFSVLMRPRYRWEVLGLLALVFAVQILRAWISLRAVGLHLDLGDATLIFVLTGVLGVLPTGITAAPTAASLVVVGSHGVGRAAGSGILTTGSLVVATIVYGLVGAGTYLLARHRLPAPAPAPSNPSDA